VAGHQRAQERDRVAHVLGTQPTSAAIHDALLPSTAAS
jgi:hypothetical protein